LEEKEELPQEKGKKPYMKPEFRYERVFEVQALACTKLSGGGARCIGSRKTS
jgi:hypothetical protein